MAKTRDTCTEPDYDQPGLTCGRPLPCPQHAKGRVTSVIGAGKSKPDVFTGARTAVSREFREPVGNLHGPNLQTAIHAAMDEMQHRFPGLGCVMFVFDIGEGGGLAYLSNAHREDVRKMMREWLAKT